MFAAKAPAFISELARPRSDRLNHLPKNWLPPVNTGDSATPNRQRTTARLARLPTSPVAAVKTDHSASDAASTGRGPNLCSSAATGIWKTK